MNFLQLQSLALNAQLPTNPVGTAVSGESLQPIEIKDFYELLNTENSALKNAFDLLAGIENGTQPVLADTENTIHEVVMGTENSTHEMLERYQRVLNVFGPISGQSGLTQNTGIDLQAKTDNLPYGGKSLPPLVGQPGTVPEVADRATQLIFRSEPNLTATPQNTQAVMPHDSAMPLLPDNQPQVSEGDIPLQNRVLQETDFVKDKGFDDGLEYLSIEPEADSVFIKHANDKVLAQSRPQMEAMPLSSYSAATVSTAYADANTGLITPQPLLQASKFDLSPQIGIEGGSRSLPLTDAGYEVSFAKTINWMADKGVQNARLMVNPPELGAIDIQLEVVENDLKLNVVTHSAMARDSLEGAVPRLREMFVSGEMNLVQVDISQRDTGNPQMQDQPYAESTEQHEHTDSKESTVNEQESISTTSQAHYDGLVDAYA